GQELVEQVAPARVVPEMMVRIADGQRWLEDLLSHLRQPPVAVNCVAHAGILTRRSETRKQRKGRTNAAESRSACDRGHPAPRSRRALMRSGFVESGHHAIVRGGPRLGLRIA